MSAVLLALAVLLTAPSAAAGEARIAVAANFAVPAGALAGEFSRSTGHTLAVSPGSTGKLYAQVRNGAPFDVLLAADEETPRRMEREELAVPGSRFTYALGKLALWSPTNGFVDDKGEILKRGTFKRLAIANPRLAPYGAAAVETMKRLGVWGLLEDRLVEGENIAQAFQFVASGNADLGFVALSQITGRGTARAGSYWLVPHSLHAPLRQDAVLLAAGAQNPAARDFLAYLRGGRARELIGAYGYDLP